MCQEQLNEEIVDVMVRTAKAAREKSYSPYSGCKVGACVLASDGTLYGGCNVENASLGLSCCAERVAVYKAVTDMKTEFDAIAVVANTEEPFVPCGACTQVIAEFEIPSVILSNLRGDVRIMSAKELAPYAVTMGTNKRYNAKEK